MRLFKDYNVGLILILASIGTVILFIISLSQGIYDVFPYLYILPIILISYFYPRRGMLASFVLGSLYMASVFFFGLFNLALITISTAWFYVIVSVGVVISSLSEGLLREERRYHGIFENSQSGLFTVDRESLHLMEVNQQCAQRCSIIPFPS